MANAGKDAKTALEAALSHYTENKRQSMEVPEWPVNGKPLTIWWDLQTIHQAEALVGKMKDNADMIVLMAKDEAGNPLFADKKEAGIKLRRGADLKVLQRIAMRMSQGATIVPSMVDEAEGN
jgi:hypothetical protein